jgi:hypothetical protein
VARVTGCHSVGPLLGSLPDKLQDRTAEVNWVRPGLRPVRLNSTRSRPAIQAERFGALSWTIPLESDAFLNNLPTCRRDVLLGDLRQTLERRRWHGPLHPAYHPGEFG